MTKTDRSLSFVKGGSLAERAFDKAKKEAEKKKAKK